MPSVKEVGDEIRHNASATFDELYLFFPFAKYRNIVQCTKIDQDM